MLIAKSPFENLSGHVLLLRLYLAGISQDVLHSLDLAENNLKTNFCLERHFIQPQRQEIGEK